MGSFCSKSFFSSVTHWFLGVKLHVNENDTRESSYMEHPVYGGNIGRIGDNREWEERMEGKRSGENDDY